MKNFFEKLKGVQKSRKFEKGGDISGIVKNETEFENIKERFEKLEELYRNLKTQIENIDVVEEAKKFFASFLNLSQNYLTLFNKFQEIKPPQEKYKEKIKEIESSLIGLIEKINIYIISYILTKNKKLIKFFFPKNLDILHEEIDMYHPFIFFKREIIENIVKTTLNHLFRNDENYLKFLNYIESFWRRSDLETTRNYLLIGLLIKSPFKKGEEIDKKATGIYKNLVDIETKLKNIDDLLNKIKRILKKYENYLKEKSDHSIKTKIIFYKNIIAFFDKKFIENLLNILENDLNQIGNYLRRYRFNDINAEIERIEYLMDTLKF